MECLVIAGGARIPATQQLRLHSRPAASALPGPILNAAIPYARAAIRSVPSHDRRDRAGAETDGGHAGADARGMGGDHGGAFRLAERKLERERRLPIGLGEGLGYRCGYERQQMPMRKLSRRGV